MAISKEKMNLMSKPHTDLLTKVNELNEQTAAHQRDFECLVKAVQTAQDEKDEAKKSYAAELDAGNADKMQECLDKIREANSRIQTLTAEMKSYLQKVPPLREAQSQLVKQARNLMSEKEQGLKDSKQQLERAKTIVNAASESLRYINDLQDVIEKTTAKK